MAGVLQLVVGLLFWWWALRQWTHRPGEGEDVALPGWLQAVQELGAVRAVGLGFLLGGLNPKNLGLAASAGATIGAAELGASLAMVAVTAFVVLGSTVLFGVVGLYFVAPERARPVLNALRGWLTIHNTAVMLVLFLVLGATLVGDGLRALL